MIVNCCKANTVCSDTNISAEACSWFVGVRSWSSTQMVVGKVTSMTPSGERTAWASSPLQWWRSSADEQVDKQAPATQHLHKLKDTQWSKVATYFYSKAVPKSKFYLSILFFCCFILHYILEGDFVLFPPLQLFDSYCHLLLCIWIFAYKNWNMMHCFRLSYPTVC